MGKEHQSSNHFEVSQAGKGGTVRWSYPPPLATDVRQNQKQTNDETKRKRCCAAGCDVYVVIYLAFVG